MLMLKKQKNQKIWKLDFIDIEVTKWQQSLMTVFFNFLSKVTLQNLFVDETILSILFTG